MAKTKMTKKQQQNREKERARQEALREAEATKVAAAEEHTAKCEAMAAETAPERPQVSEPKEQDNGRAERKFKLTSVDAAINRAVSEIRGEAYSADAPFTLRVFRGQAGTEYSIEVESAAKCSQCDKPAVFTGMDGKTLFCADCATKLSVALAVSREKAFQCYDDAGSSVTLTIKAAEYKAPKAAAGKAPSKIADLSEENKVKVKQAMDAPSPNVIVELAAKMAGSDVKMLQSICRGAGVSVRGNQTGNADWLRQQLVKVHVQKHLGLSL